MGWAGWRHHIHVLWVAQACYASWVDNSKALRHCILPILLTLVVTGSGWQLMLQPHRPRPAQIDREDSMLWSSAIDPHTPHGKNGCSMAAPAALHCPHIVPSKCNKPAQMEHYLENQLTCMEPSMWHPTPNTKSFLNLYMDGHFLTL